MESTTIEFFRFGKDSVGGLRRDDKYIRTCGYGKPAEEVEVRIEPKELRRNQNRLRYRPDRTLEAQSEAQKVLGVESERFLAGLSLEDGAGLHQVDIVTHASELRAYPFEAIYATVLSESLQSPDAGLILTRRIRSEFSYTVPPWPEVPSVLFVHAEVDHDLPKDLVERHRRVLCEALAPWGSAKTLEETKRLVVREVDSVEALAEARASGDFSYIHILAHGARVSEEDMEEHESEWGLRLGRARSNAVSPQAVAGALRLSNDRPLVVTLAACDGASSGPELGNVSLVETLHRNGIPVVVASQFPLTIPGSVTLAREFYSRLLSGTDVRVAIHGARVALRAEARAAGERMHDWLSLVAYVRLPAEGYAHYLKTFALRVQLHMLEAARKDAEPLLASSAKRSSEVFDDAERRLETRIAELRKQKEAYDGRQDSRLVAECAGLLASGCKSLAELRFVRSRRAADSLELHLAGSKSALDESQRWYAEIFDRNLAAHWHGIQKLSLEAVLTGRISEPLELTIVRRVAEKACTSDANEYWACGTLAEAIMLTTLVAEESSGGSASDALRLLCERAAANPEDKGFAVKSTRRQLHRYVNWWTKEHGYFPGRESDLSAEAQALLACLPAGLDG